MHSSQLAKHNAIAHNELLRIAKVLATHFGLEASQAALEAIAYSSKNKDTTKLKQSRAIAALLQEIAYKVGADTPKADDQPLEDIPDAGDDSLEAVDGKQPLQQEKTDEKQREPKPQPPMIVVEDPRPRPKKDK